MAKEDITFTERKRLYEVLESIESYIRTQVEYNDERIKGCNDRLEELEKEKKEVEKEKGNFSYYDYDYLKKEIESTKSETDAYMTVLAHLYKL
ncbi:MAG: hypothetical protein IJM25_11735 [Eubacterium sp.]|nr:hypothetical protein [Eubacterium sp.]